MSTENVVFLYFPQEKKGCGLEIFLITQGASIVCRVRKTPFSKIKRILLDSTIISE